MNKKKNQEISPKFSPRPDLAHMQITIAVFKSAREKDKFYYHVVNILWANVDERVKDLIREYFNDVMDQDEKAEGAIQLIQSRCIHRRLETVKDSDNAFHCLDCEKILYGKEAK